MMAEEGYIVTTQGLDFLQKHVELVDMLRTHGSIPKAVSSVESSKEDLTALKRQRELF